MENDADTTKSTAERVGKNVSTLVSVPSTLEDSAQTVHAQPVSVVFSVKSTETNARLIHAMSLEQTRATTDPEQEHAIATLDTAETTVEQSLTSVTLIHASIQPRVFQALVLIHAHVSVGSMERIVKITSMNASTQKTHVTQQGQTIALMAIIHLHVYVRLGMMASTAPMTLTIVHQISASRVPLVPISSTITRATAPMTTLARTAIQTLIAVRTLTIHARTEVSVQTELDMVSTHAQAVMLDGKDSTAR
jgi:hypothetical protein